MEEFVPHFFAEFSQTGGYSSMNCLFKFLLQHLHQIQVGLWLQNLHFISFEPLRGGYACVLQIIFLLHNTTWFSCHKLMGGHSSSGFSGSKHNPWFNQLWRVVRVLKQQSSHRPSLCLTVGMMLLLWSAQSTDYPSSPRGYQEKCGKMCDESVCSFCL